MVRLGVIDLVIEHQFEVLDNLCKGSNFKLCHALTGTPRNFQGNVSNILEIQKCLYSDDAIIDEIPKFLFSEDIISLNKSPWNVSEDLLLGLKETESLFYRISDRATATAISNQQRKLYYLVLVNYFYNIIKTSQITHVVVFDTPHSLASIIYYGLAKYFGLQVVRFEYHYLLDYSVFYEDCETPSIPDTYLSGVSTDDIKKDLPADLLDTMHATNHYFESYKANDSKKVVKDNPLANVKLLYRKRKKQTQNLIMGLFPFLFKKEIFHFTSLNGHMTPLRYRIRANRSVAKIIQLHRLYNSLVTDVDLSKKYIYFGLHMQPEKTTQPLGGEYDHHFLCIATLSACIPEGWHIYVKDHPNQFNVRKLTNANYRNKNFYKAILSLPNVSLVSLNFSSDTLIEHAQLTATITGTIGWEALNLGKPVIAFGDSYYKPCRAAGHISNVEQGREEIKRLLALSKEDVLHELYVYYHYLHHNGHLIHAGNREEKLKLSKIARETHINRLSKALRIAMLS